MGYDSGSGAGGREQFRQLGALGHQVHRPGRIAAQLLVDGPAQPARRLLRRQSVPRAEQREAERGERRVVPVAFRAGQSEAGRDRLREDVRIDPIAVSVARGEATAAWWMRRTPRCARAPGEVGTTVPGRTGSPDRPCARIHSTSSRARTSSTVSPASSRIAAALRSDPDTVERNVLDISR